MVNSLVERATSDMLIGPDWAMNIEICDMINHDPGQSKDVVKGIKKRLGSRNSKVQLLTLTLLETIIKNCGDIVHMHVAERDILHDMVKMVKKKHDFHVKEKILILIDTWQEALGGPRARYPQYYAAYQELLRAGAVFPQKSERSAAPVFTPPQTQPLSSYPQNLRNSDNQQEVAVSSTEAEYPILSLTEIQNARGIMDVLSEMLNALDPGNKEGLKQEVIVDLVEQCHAYKRRVVHFVNSTSDESLLSQGLALNDDLERLLAKHEAIASGTSVPLVKPKPETVQALVDVSAPLVDTVDNKGKTDSSSTSGSGGGTYSAHPLLPTPPSTHDLATPAKVDPKMDLLSGDDYSSAKAENSLALVPVGSSQPTSPVSQQNALVLFDMFSESNATVPISFNNQPGGSLPVQPNPLAPQFSQQQNLQFPYMNGGGPQHQNRPSLQQTHYLNGTIPQQQNTHPPPAYQSNGSSQLPQFDLSIYGQTQQHQPPPVYGAESSGALPPPPWEAQPPDNGELAGPPTVPQGQVMGNAGMYAQPIPESHLPPITQFAGGLPPQAINGGMLPHPVQVGPVGVMYPQQMQGSQMGGHGYGYGYGYGQRQDVGYIDGRMYGLSVRDDSGLRNNSLYQVSASSCTPPSKPQRSEDKLFGDLVDMARVKVPKSTTGGSM